MINHLVNDLQSLNVKDVRLLSNKPLLINDSLYVEVKDFINNTITNDELELYNNGNIRKLYCSFENLLLSNIKFYNRIISYCTIYFKNYYVISKNIFKHNIEHVIEKLTPTKLYYRCLLNDDSKKSEQEFGFDLTLEFDKFADNYEYLINNDKIFDLFVSQRSEDLACSGYLNTYKNENIQKEFEYQIMETFISNKLNYNTSINLENFKKTLINDNNLNFHKDIKNILSELYDDYKISFFNQGLHINSRNMNFYMSKYDRTYDVKFTDEDTISLFNDISKSQYFHQYLDFFYDKEYLVKTFESLLEKDLKNYIVLKFSNGLSLNDEYTICTFSKVLDKVRVTCEVYKNGKRYNSFTFMKSLKNAVKQLIDYGFSIIITKEEFTKFDIISDENKIDIIIKNIIKSAYNIDLILKAVYNKYREHNNNVIAFLKHKPEEYINLDINKNLELKGSSVDYVMDCLDNIINGNEKKTYYKIIYD